jgi:hypothetical protein
MRALRFRDFGEPPLELCRTWTTLNRLIKEEGFPPGRLIGRERVWLEDEVFDWIKSRPTGKAPLRGNAKRLAGGAQ